MEDYYPKVLIISPTPYNKKMTSRIFDAYFNGWPKEKLAQIFSYAKKPTKGHCFYFYQITDSMLLSARTKRKKEIGIEYIDTCLSEQWDSGKLEEKNIVYSSLYKSSFRRSPLFCLLRGKIWKKKYWYNDKLKKWIKEFNPDVIFVTVSNNFYIQDIALTIAKDYQLPIITCVLDDYIFVTKKIPFYTLYHKKIKKSISSLIQQSSDVIYISPNMQEYYNSYFKKTGKTIFLSSCQVCHHLLRKKDIPIFSYFGNVSLGRLDTLILISRTLQNINNDFFLYLYTNEQNKKMIAKIKKENGIKFMGSVPYVEVIKKLEESDFVFMVESMEDKKSDITRFSLSTKVADLLSSHVPIISVGNKKCGAIEYLNQNNSACVITNKMEIETKLRRFIFDYDLQSKMIDNAVETYKTNHNAKKNLTLFKSIVEEAIEKGGKRSLLEKDEHI